MNNLFDIREVSEELNESEDRIRYWTFKFKNVLSNTTVNDKKAYTDLDINILREIIYLNNHCNLTNTDILKYLTQKTDDLTIEVSKTDDLTIEVSKTDDLEINKYDNNDNIPSPFYRNKGRYTNTYGYESVSTSANSTIYKLKSNILSLLNYLKKETIELIDKEKKEKEG